MSDGTAFWEGGIWSSPVNEYVATMWVTGAAVVVSSPVISNGVCVASTEVLESWYQFVSEQAGFVKNSEQVSFVLTNDYRSVVLTDFTGTGSFTGNADGLTNGEWCARSLFGVVKTLPLPGGTNFNFCFSSAGVLTNVVQTTP